MENDVYDQYVEDYGADFLDCYRRAIRDEFSNRKLRLVTQQDIQDFGEELIILFRTAAREALLNRQFISAQQKQDYGDYLIEMLRFVSRNEKESLNASETDKSSAIRANGSISTSLNRSPFFVLGASVRDDRRKIIELADEIGLSLDSDICATARGDLTTPRKRLSAEIAWLPGVSPTSAKVLVENLYGRIDLVRRATAAPALAKANLFAAAFELLDPEMDSDPWCEWIVEFAYAVDMIESEDVLRDINEDRSVSGFPEVRGLEQIEAELAERRRHYTETVKGALEQFDLKKLVEVVTDVVERTTGSGDEHAPLLIHQLVDRYETEANRFLQPEAENVKKLIEAIMEIAHKGETGLKPLVNRLEQLARKWDAIARPIQLSMKAQGLDHPLSQNVASQMRSLAIYLFNEHDMLDTASRLNKTLCELFAKLPEVVERLREDSEALEGFYENRKDAQRQDAELAKEITYSAEIGLMFKDMLRISPNGVEWKGKRMPLESISRVRWGAVSKSVNGIPTGTDYTIAVGDSRSEMVIQTRKGDVYGAFIDRLWKAVCVRLLTENCKALKSGKSLSFGGAVIDDAGVQLTKKKFLSSEVVYRHWDQVSYQSHNGSLIIVDKNDSKATSVIPYLHTPNAHVLEAMIRLSFKNWKGRLSGFLEK